MKKVLLTMIALAISTPALAGNLVPGTYDPPVMAPPAHSWTGVYGGVGVGSYIERNHWSRTTQVPYTYEEEVPWERTEEVPWERIETTEVPDGWERECVGIPGRHNGNKCQVSQLTFDGLDLREVNNPWNRNGLRTDGNAGEIVKYQTNSYYGIWLNDNASYTFSSAYGGAAPTSAGKPTSNNVLRETFTIVETLITGTDLVTTTGVDIVTREGVNEVTETGHTDERKIGAEAFVGYMHDFGGLVGAVEVGYAFDGAYADAQGCADLGRLLTCAGYGTDGPVTSLNIAVGQNWMLGAKAVFHDEGTRPSVRAAYRF